LTQKREENAKTCSKGLTKKKKRKKGTKGGNILVNEHKKRRKKDVALLTLRVKIMYVASDKRHPQKSSVNKKRREKEENDVAVLEDPQGTPLDLNGNIL